MLTPRYDVPEQRNPCNNPTSGCALVKPPAAVLAPSPKVNSAYSFDTDLKSSGPVGSRNHLRLVSHYNSLFVPQLPPGTCHIKKIFKWTNVTSHRSFFQTVCQVCQVADEYCFPVPLDACSCVHRWSYGYTQRNSLWLSSYAFINPADLLPVNAIRLCDLMFWAA